MCSLKLKQEPCFGGCFPEPSIIPEFIEVSLPLLYPSTAQTKARLEAIHLCSPLNMHISSNARALRFHRQHDLNHSPKTDRQDNRSVTTRVESESRTVTGTV